MTSSSVKNVYFFCRDTDFNRNPPCHWYQHLSVCLAEGLQELGINVFANIDHWQISATGNQYLFKHDSQVTPDDCSIVIVNDAYTADQKPLPKDLFHPKRKYITVFLDGLDPMRSRAFEPCFRQFDYILQAHYSAKSFYPSNIYPWTFGLSNRILDFMHQVPAYHERKQRMLVNFRHTSNMHSVRSYTSKTFLRAISQKYEIDSSIDKASEQLSDADKMHYVQTGERHFPAYYNRLKESAISACFGGFFVSPWPKDYSKEIHFTLRRLIKRLGIKTNHIMQWESWRFWESLAAGCVPIHLDFEKYGILLPEMPTNWNQYVGIDLDNFEKDIDRLVSEPKLIELISQQGREWALKHYSPQPTAERFLHLTGVRNPK